MGLPWPCQLFSGRRKNAFSSRAPCGPLFLDSYAFRPRRSAGLPRLCRVGVAWLHSALEGSYTSSSRTLGGHLQTPRSPTVCGCAARAGLRGRLANTATPPPPLMPRQGSQLGGANYYFFGFSAASPQPTGYCCATANRQRPPAGQLARSAPPRPGSRGCDVIGPPPAAIE